MAIIIGVVRRVTNREETCRFYKMIGLETDTHQHGGPVHSEIGPVSEKFVYETYKSSQRFSSDAIMIEVSDIDEVLNKLSTVGVTPHYTVANGKVVYVKDPDGSDVILIQS